MDMVTASPPVSPSVVARILMTQNARVTSGSLLNAVLCALFMRRSFPRGDFELPSSFALASFNKVSIRCLAFLGVFQHAPGSGVDAYLLSHAAVLDVEGIS